MEQHPTQKPILGADNNSLVALLAIHLVAYAMLGFLKVIYFLDGTPIEAYYAHIFHLFTLPKIGTEWLAQPWSVFTFNWIHDGFWSLLTNMIWLSLFGIVMQNINGNKHLFPIYFYSSILGGLAFVLISFTAPTSFLQYPLFGAGAGVTAVVIASTIMAPRYKFLPNIGAGIPLWSISILYFLLQIAILNQYQIANTLVMISASLMGVVYVMLLKRGTDLGKWMHNLLHWLNKRAAPKTNG